MNKGVRIASGQWLLFLGADDRLDAPETLRAVRTALEGQSNGIFFARLFMKMVAHGKLGNVPIFTFVILFHHQACFYHRSLFVKDGFDESLKIQADYDLNLNFGWRRSFPDEAHHSVPLRMRGVSDAGQLAKLPRRNYRSTTVPKATDKRFWDLLSVLRYLRKKFVSHAKPTPE